MFNLKEKLNNLKIYKSLSDVDNTNHTDFDLIRLVDTDYYMVYHKDVWIICENGMGDYINFCKENLN